VPEPKRWTDEWYAQADEPVIEPDLEIVDPHHHLWPPGGALPYGLLDLHRDVGSGHHVVQTVFIECGAAYRTGGSSALASVGETEFVAGVARDDPTNLISAIVAHVDLRTANLDELLDVHAAAAEGRLRGIRDAIAFAEHPEVLTIPGRAARGLSRDDAFRKGLRRLGERGLTYDSWHYHYQNRDFLELARAVPGTTMVLDHFGTPLGVGPYAEQRDEIFEGWCRDVAELARCDNVVAKLGGLAMIDNGFGWDHASSPPTSDRFLDAQARYYQHAIEVFSPERCMFESNFPVDRVSISYRVLWNAFKKLTVGYSVDERAAMFSGTARRVYALEPPRRAG
jgi:predicted TIM-barrel fold metal-dependent hydrolase